MAAFVKARWFYTGRRSTIKRIYIHSMESPEKGTTAEAVANYFARTERKASAHWCFDNDSEVQCVRDEDTAFHMGGDNSASIGLEHAGYAGQASQDEWLDTFGVAMLEISSKRCAKICQTWAIPPVWLDVVDLTEDQYGISSHLNGSHAFGVSDHWDPGYNFPVEYYLSRVRYHMGLEDDFLAGLTEAESRELYLKTKDIHALLTNLDDPKSIPKQVSSVTAPQRDSLSALIRRSLGNKSDGTADNTFIDWLRSKLP